MISVFVPTLDEEAIIESALRRLAEMPGDFEIVVADGGSADSTRRLAGNWAKVVAAEPGRGPGLNEGAAHARGEVLLFLHADTRLPRGAFAAIEKALADPEVVGGCFSVAFDRDDWRCRLVGWMYAVFGRAGFFYGDAGMFVRRSTFETLGGFKPLPLMEDLDFCLRLRRAGRRTRLPLAVTTSARRWEKQGFVKTVVVYLAIQGLYLLGLRRAWLFRLYRAIR